MDLAKALADAIDEEDSIREASRMTRVRLVETLTYLQSIERYLNKLERDAVAAEKQRLEVVERIQANRGKTHGT